MVCSATGMLRKPCSGTGRRTWRRLWRGRLQSSTLGQYEPELLKLAVRHAVSPAEAAFYLREIQARA